MSYLQSHLVPLAQQDYLQRQFSDALVPNVMFLALAPTEELASGNGGTLTSTVAGNMKPDLKPVVPGEDAAPQSNTYEWHITTIDQYKGSRDIPMNQAALTIEGARGFFMQVMREQAENCAIVLNLLARNALYKAYLAGNTYTYRANGNTTSVYLVSGNGFNTKIVNGKELGLSVTVTRTVKINGVTATATGWAPLDPFNPDGPGVLTISAPLNVAANVPVLDSERSAIIRPDQNPLDGLLPNSLATLQLFRKAASELRNNGVPPMPDGKYHVHLAPGVEEQLQSDNEYQRLFEGVPDKYIPDGSIGTIGNLRFFPNEQCPQPGDINSPGVYNIGDLPSSTRTTTFAPGYFGELTNNKGTQVQRSIVLGRGAIVTKYLDESKVMLAEASAPIGKQVTWAMVGGSLQLMAGSQNMGNVRITIRPPIDRMGQQTAVTWTTTRGYTVPGNLLSGLSYSRFKRCLVVETGYQPLDY